MPERAVWTERDEQANLVWAVERVVTDERGEQVDRRTVPEPALGTAAPAAGGDPDYVLQTSVPDAWSPLVAQQVSPGQVRFQLVALDEFGHPGPQGTLLTPSFWMRSRPAPEGVASDTITASAVHSRNTTPTRLTNGSSGQAYLSASDRAQRLPHFARVTTAATA